MFLIPKKTILVFTMCSAMLPAYFLGSHTSIPSKQPAPISKTKQNHGKSSADHKVHVHLSEKFIEQHKSSIEVCMFPIIVVLAAMT